MMFTSYFGWGSILSYTLSLMIVLQNLLTRMGFIRLTKLIKFTSNSARMRFIVVSVFIIYFLNYGVLYLLAPMQLNIPLVSSLVSGIYWDFNQYWFTDVGYQITTVMVINAIFPPLEIFLLWLWIHVKRSYD